jgi:hypothetical protein
VVGARYSARPGEEAELMKKLIPAIASAALLSGLALAAVPAGASTPAVAPKGACKYLTTREAGRILGTRAGAGKSVTRKSGGIKTEGCEWKAKKKGTGGIEGQALSLEIAVESGTGIVDEYQAAKVEDPEDTEAVSGLGDDAFLADLDLHALVGEQVVSVELHNYRYPEPLTTDEIQQKEVEAAGLVIDRLG